FEDRLIVSLAGRAAEEITFGEVTTGSQNDLEQATSLARKMVTEYGMSSKLGPRTFGKREELVFLGREIHEQRNYGEKVAMLIDKEVDALIQKAYTTARKILTDNKERLKLIADRLMAKETIEESEFESLLKEPLPSPQLQASPAS
ncbi:MAG: cell division protein FtsH, partial [Chloroflexi bacterium]|nr:cell division protein FtsH [Chloroflexota bacterium]